MENEGLKRGGYVAVNPRSGTPLWLHLNDYIVPKSVVTKLGLASLEKHVARKGAEDDQP